MLSFTKVLRRINIYYYEQSKHKVELLSVHKYGASSIGMGDTSSKWPLDSDVIWQHCLGQEYVTFLPLATPYYK